MQHGRKRQEKPHNFRPDHQKPGSRERSGTRPRTEAKICGRTSDEGTSDGRAQGAQTRSGPDSQKTGGQKATVEAETEKKSYDQDHTFGRSHSSSSGGRVFMEAVQPVERRINAACGPKTASDSDERLRPERDGDASD